MDIKRLGMVNCVSNVNFWIKYLDDENMIENFMEYCLKRARKSSLEYPVNCGVDNVDKKYMSNHYYKCKYLGKTYYGAIKKSSKAHLIDFYIYAELPLVIDDDTFSWKENTRYNSKEATVVRGHFEYLCIVNADGNGKVIVRYNKCENYHRNRVTIAEFYVDDAYNERFIEAIDKWTKEFKESIAA